MTFSEVSAISTHEVTLDAELATNGIMERINLSAVWVGVRVLSVRVLFVLAFESEVESRTQGSRSRSRTQKESKAKDSPSEAKDRNARCQGPRTHAQVFSKKKVFKNVFSGLFQKKRSLK